VSITIAMLSPLPGSTRATQDAAVVLSIAAPGEAFTAAIVEVNGVTAYRYDGAPAFSYPAASGTARATASSQSVSVKMRRRFAPGSRVSVRVRATSDATPETTASFEFSIDEPSGSVRDDSVRRTRVDAPFPPRALELYRQAALGAVGSRGGSALALLVHRVKPSQLGCLLPALPGAALSAAASFRADELEPVARLADAADQLDFMRPLAEEELRGLGVGPEVVAAVSRVAASSYPQERAAALALSVVLAADRLA